MKNTVIQNSLHKLVSQSKHLRTSLAVLLFASLTGCNRQLSHEIPVINRSLYTTVQKKNISTDRLAASIQKNQDIEHLHDSTNLVRVWDQELGEIYEPLLCFADTLAIASVSDSILATLQKEDIACLVHDRKMEKLLISNPTRHTLLQSIRETLRLGQNITIKSIKDSLSTTRYIYNSNILHSDSLQSIHGYEIKLQSQYRDRDESSYKNGGKQISRIAAGTYREDERGSSWIRASTSEHRIQREIDRARDIKTKHCQNDSAAQSFVERKFIQENQEWIDAANDKLKYAKEMYSAMGCSQDIESLSHIQHIRDMQSLQEDAISEIESTPRQECEEENDNIENIVQCGVIQGQILVIQQGEGCTGNFTYTITSIGGQFVASGSIRHSIDLRELITQPGTYIITLNNQDSVQTLKFVR